MSEKQNYDEAVQVIKTNGKCWILLYDSRGLQKMCPAIWNLQIPKQKKLQ